MHLLTTPLLYRILTFNKSPQYTKATALVLSLLFTLVMTVHMLMDEFLLHAAAFGASVYLIATGVLRLIYQQVPDANIRKTVKTIARFGTCKLRRPSDTRLPAKWIYSVSFAFGFCVWLVDEWACGMLNDVRKSVGLPLAFFLELHGW
jgi:dihydroceramidase